MDLASQLTNPQWDLCATTAHTAQQFTKITCTKAMYADQSTPDLGIFAGPKLGSAQTQHAAYSRGSRLGGRDGACRHTAPSVGAVILEIVSLDTSAPYNSAR